MKTEGVGVIKIGVKRFQEDNRGHGRKSPPTKTALAQCPVFQTGKIGQIHLFLFSSPLLLNQTGAANIGTKLLSSILLHILGTQRLGGPMDE